MMAATVLGSQTLARSGGAIEFPSAVIIANIVERVTKHLASVIFSFKSEKHWVLHVHLKFLIILHGKSTEKAESDQCDRRNHDC